MPCVRPIWDDADELAKIAQVEGAVAVIVDSIVPAMSGSALSAKDAEAAGRLRRGQCDRSAVTLDRPRHEGRRGRMPYGSVFFANLSRLSWRVRADDQKRITLTNEKYTDGDRLPPTTLVFDWDDRLTVTHTTPQLTPAVLGGIVANVGTVTAHGLADAVRAAGYPVGRSWLHLLAGRAVTEGYLERPSRGRYAATGQRVDNGVSEPTPTVWTNGGQLAGTPLTERVD